MKNSFCVFPCIPWSISSSRFDGSEDFVRQSLAYTKQLSVHQPRPSMSNFLPSWQKSSSQQA
jgi:hypothetical protein